MNQDDFAIRVNHVSKMYHLWDSRHDRLVFPFKRFLSSIFSKDKQNNISGYKEFYALKNISLDIKKGESWGLVGLNGSGKSTLLKMISGNLRPSAGSIEVDGKVVILDYGNGFNGDFTGKENIYMKATIMGLNRKKINTCYDSIVDFAELGDFIHQPVKTYSSGMIARLGFAIMAHIDADIMITDEALAVGDVFFVQKCMKFIRSFIKKGTFLFVSHSMNDVLSLCENAIWLENGTIMAKGLAKEVTNLYINSHEMKKTQALAVDEFEGIVNDSKPIQKNKISMTQPKLSQLMHAKVPMVYTDMRLKYPNHAQARNDIYVMPTELIQESGIGGAKIIGVSLVDEDRNPCSCIVGSELVLLTIEVLAECDLSFPIVGFQVLDRLGQVLFADNSALVTQDQRFNVRANQIFVAEFTFQIPLLPAGNYVFRIAVAQGETPGDAILLHIIENALSLYSVVSENRHGLVGIPMKEIVLKFQDEACP